MRNIWIIASREFKLHFISPLAYAVATMVYLILGIIFYLNINYGLQMGQITPDGRMVLGPLVTILLFATPALTMRLLADEQRMGTMELLLTAPVRDWEMVVGKWLGSFFFMLLLLAVTWVYPLILNRMTRPGIDQGLLVSAYLGLTLFAASMLGLGVMFSALFKSPVAAFFVTLAAFLFLWIVGGLGSGAGVGSEIASQLSFVDHFYNNLYRGVINLGDVIYFLSITALALFLGTQIIEARRWQ
jgi:ABC-2 type transport system permease protein